MTNIFFFQLRKSFEQVNIFSKICTRFKNITIMMSDQLENHKQVDQIESSEQPKSSAQLSINTHLHTQQAMQNYQHQIAQNCQPPSGKLLLPRRSILELNQVADKIKRLQTANTIQISSDSKNQINNGYIENQKLKMKKRRFRRQFGNLENRKRLLKYAHNNIIANKFRVNGKISKATLSHLDAYFQIIKKIVQ